MFAKSYVPEVALVLPKLSKLTIESKSVISSIKVWSPKTKPLRTESKKQLFFVPLKGVPSVSSLSVKTASFGNGSGTSIITEVSQH